MKKTIFRPYFDAVKPHISMFAEEGAGGGDDDFDLSGLGGDEGDDDEGGGDGDDVGDDGNQGGGDDDGQDKGSDDGDDSGDTDSDDESGGSDGDDGDGSDEGDKDGDDKGGSDDSGDDGADGDDKGGDEGDDFFGDVNEGAAADEKGTSYNAVATDLGLELEDPENKTEFIEKVNGLIKGAQKKFDLSEYNDTAKRLINFAQDNGDFTDFFTNPKIARFNNFLDLSPEEKFREVRGRQLAQDNSLSADDVDAKLDEEVNEMSTRALKDQADKFDDEIIKARDKEIVNLLGDKETQISAAKSKAESAIEQEKQDLVKYVEAQTDFLGLPLTEANKKGIVNAINNGTFDLAVEQNPAASKFHAFMFNKFYKKFVQHLDKSTKEAGRAGYQKGLGKGKGTAFNKEKPDAGSKGTGGNKTKWSDLQDIE